MNDVIVGVDGSESARRAAEAAARLAAAFDVNLHIVTCVHRNEPRTVSVGSDEFQVDGMEEAEQLVRSVARDLDYDKVTVRAAVGDPADVLTEEAESREAQTIVVGNRRVQGVSRILGSVATAVLRHAPCDVLVAQTRE